MGKIAAALKLPDMKGDVPLRDKDGIINLDAPGIPEKDYLEVVQKLADGLNAAARKHHWCWVWMKFGTAINPLIVQGPKAKWREGSWDVRVAEARPEDRYPQEWFTEEGWIAYDKVNQDGERMEELRKSYGRILRVVKEGHISIDDANEIFATAKLPRYVRQRKEKWRAEIYTTDSFATEDIAASKEKIQAAWKRFLEETGLSGYGGYPQFSRVNRAEIELDPKDTAEFIGNPEYNYNPFVMPDGRRLDDTRGGW